MLHFDSENELEKSTCPWGLAWGCNRPCNIYQPSKYDSFVYRSTLSLPVPRYSTRMGLNLPLSNLRFVVEFRGCRLGRHGRLAARIFRELADDFPLAL
jgi:hypothetical protein